MKKQDKPKKPSQRVNEQVMHWILKMVYSKEQT